MLDVTVQLERPRTAATGPLPRSPVLTGAVAAGWAGALGLALVVVTVLLVWLLAPHGAAGPGDVIHAGVLVWLAANHGTVVLSSGSLSLVPLGLVLVPAVVLFRSGCWAGRASAEALPAAVAATVAMTASYAVGAAVLASASSQPGSAGQVGSVLLGAAGLAAVSGGAGVLHGAGLWGELADRLPEPAIPVLRGAATGLAVLLGGGALILAVTLMDHFGQVTDLSRSVQGSATGGLALLLLGVASIPTAVVWATAFCVGPGFAVGVGTTVAPAGVALGPVPALPLLGALPGTGPAASIALAALAVPLLAGIVVGLVAASRPASTLGRTAGEALAAGALAGAGLGLLALLAAGSLGAVRMSDLGPDAIRVGFAAAVEVGALAAAVAYEASRHRTVVTAAAAWAGAAAARLTRGRRRR
jgi:Family of unknown function (DUF6350)